MKNTATHHKSTKDGDNVYLSIPFDFNGARNTFPKMFYDYLKISDSIEIPSLPGLIIDELLSDEAIAHCKKNLYTEEIDLPVSPLSILTEVQNEFLSNGNKKVVAVGGSELINSVLETGYLNHSNNHGVVILGKAEDFFLFQKRSSERSVIITKRTFEASLTNINEILAPLKAQNITSIHLSINSDRLDLIRDPFTIYRLIEKLSHNFSINSVGFAGLQISDQPVNKELALQSISSLFIKVSEIMNGKNSLS